MAFGGLGDSCCCNCYYDDIAQTGNREHTGSEGTVSAALEAMRYAKVPKSFFSASVLLESVAVRWQRKMAQK